MNKKDIALTVGGTLATMVLAYLLYRHQQTASADAAANSDAAQQAAIDQQYQQEQYLSQLPSVGTSSLATSNEGTIDTTASTGTSADASTTGLLSNIISAFAGSINQGTAGSTVNASLIPTIDSGVNLNLVNVPITADQVLAASNAGSPATLLPSAGPIAKPTARASV